MNQSRSQVAASYRSLYKHTLRAIQYSKPSRYIARDRIRAAFRNGRPDEFDMAKVARTVEFLKGAASTRGLEHKIVKNLFRVWGERANLYRFPVQKEIAVFQKQGYDDFDRTVEMLNVTMGLCIR